jgi:uncharacterized Zn finger protein (UPF0148 family)
MQRLEITGNTPEELYFNCIKTLSIMLKGAGTTAEPVEPVAETVATTQCAECGQPQFETTSGVTCNNGHGGADAKVVEQEIIPPATKKRGRPAKTAEPVKSDELNDEIPDLGGEPKKELTLDGDIKPRLQAIAAACTKRGMSMPETVAYCQKLYAPFGIAKAPQLKPEQYEEFLEASEAYLDGAAEA